MGAPLARSYLYTASNDDDDIPILSLPIQTISTAPVEEGGVVTNVDEMKQSFVDG